MEEPGFSEWSTTLKIGEDKMKKKLSNQSTTIHRRKYISGSAKIPLHPSRASKMQNKAEIEVFWHRQKVQLESPEV